MIFANQPLIYANPGKWAIHCLIKSITHLNDFDKLRTGNQICIKFKTKTETKTELKVKKEKFEIKTFYLSFFRLTNFTTEGERKIFEVLMNSKIPT